MSIVVILLAAPGAWASDVAAPSPALAPADAPVAARALASPSPALPPAVASQVGAPLPAPSAIDGGSAAYREGHWAVVVAEVESVPLAARSARQQLDLARARAHLGLLVEALDDYERLLAPQPPHLALAGWKAVVHLAEAEGDALGQRLPWAKVDLGPGVPEGASVFIDRRWVASGRLRASYPVNPGWHTFLLELKGEVRAARRVYFEEGQQRSVELSAPERPAPESKSASQAIGLSGAVESGAAAPDRSGPGNLRVASYVTLGVGALGTMVGVGYSVHAASLSEDFDSCYGSSCGARAFEQRDAIATAASVADVGFVVGALGLVSGSVLFLVSVSNDNGSRRATAPAVRPYVGLGSAGLSGTF